MAVVFVGGAHHRAIKRPARANRAGPTITVRVSPTDVLTTVPRSFLGLSLEDWALPPLAERAAATDRILRLLHVPGGGPLILRIGGNSADHTYWGVHPSPPTPRWRVYELRRGWFTDAAAILRHAHVRVLLDLNLVANSPGMAVRVARTALRTFPPHTIAGFAIGNEPDFYRRVLGLLAYPARTYASQFRAYAARLAPLAPRVPIVGPELAVPQGGLEWLSQMIGAAGRHLGLLTVHHYALSACAHPGSPAYPTIARVLSERTSAGFARVVTPVVQLARRMDIPFRLTEMNSVTCGGRRGVSNSFATALWAPDTLFELLRAGVRGVNVHVRIKAVNGAFTVMPRGLFAHPLLYGLALFGRTLGRGAQLVRSVASAPLIKVWSVLVSGDILHVLLIDKRREMVRVAVKAPAAGVATVQRLLAPAVSATSGVTLAGQWLSARARWVGHRHVQTLQPDDGSYRLSLPGYSAAILSFRL